MRHGTYSGFPAASLPTASLPYMDRNGNNPFPNACISGRVATNGPPSRLRRGAALTCMTPAARRASGDADHPVLPSRSIMNDGLCSSGVFLSTSRSGVGPPLFSTRFSHTAYLAGSAVLWLPPNSLPAALMSAPRIRSPGTVTYRPAPLTLPSCSSSRPTSPGLTAADRFSSAAPPDMPVAMCSLQCLTTRADAPTADEEAATAP